MQEFTYQDLHKWTKKSFEKLGWMILAIPNGDSSKINCYVNSLYQLRISLLQKVQKVQEQDRKADLMILLNQVKYLIEFVNLNLKVSK